MKKDFVKTVSDHFIFHINVMIKAFAIFVVVGGMINILPFFLCKHKYKSKFPSQYKSYEPSSESYQDICFNLNKSCSDKRFYSQGTQTNFVESKICQTQTLSYEEIAFYSKLFNSYFHESGTFDSE